MYFLGPYNATFPDEIVEQILAPVLHVSDKAYTDTSINDNPFATYQLTSSTVLEVCKAWLRVATPLLYRTVVLRSKAQAQVLALTLSRKPNLGSFVRRIRIEGGYGHYVLEILKQCPRLNDLWLSARLYSDESINGYAKGFSFINPQRLIVVDDHHSRDSSIRKASYEALAKAVRDSWTCLSTVIMDMNPSMVNRALPFIYGLLKGRSSIEFLGLCSSSAYPRGPALRLLKLQSLKQIRFLAGPFDQKPGFENLSYDYDDILIYAMLQNRHIYNKVSYVRSFSTDVSNEARTPPSKTIRPSTDACHKPFVFRGASEEDRRRILTNILYFAMLPGKIGSAYVRDWPCSVTFQSVRSTLAKVSKEFRDIAHAILYDAPVVYARRFRALAESPFTGDINGLWLRGSISDSAAHQLDDLIARCRGLRFLSAKRGFFPESSTTSDDDLVTWTDWGVKFCIPTTSLLSLANHSANTLQHLHLGIRSEKKSPTKAEFSTIMNALNQLRRLRSLILTSNDNDPRCGPRTESKAIEFKPPSDFLSCLERLNVEVNTIVNLSLVVAMARVKLPMLNRLSVKCGPGLRLAAAAFIERHGQKLVYLQSNPALMRHLIHCHNAVRWDCVQYSGDGLDPSIFELLDRHVQYALSEISVSCMDFSPQEVQALTSADLSCLQRFKLIHLGGVAWPNSQRGIEGSPWIEPLEALFKKHKIWVSDMNNIRWSPRLKVRENRQE